MSERFWLNVLATPLLLAAVVSPLLLFSWLGLPPCQDESRFYDVTRWSVPLSLLAGSVWLFRLKRVRSSGFLYALALPVCAIGLNVLAARAEVPRQSACAQRSLHEALAVCKMNRAHYREGIDEHGYRTVTLIAPGETDKAWDCLWRWTLYNGSVSTKIDESVYEHYRRVHGQR